VYSCYVSLCIRFNWNKTELPRASRELRFFYAFFSFHFIFWVFFMGFMIIFIYNESVGNYEKTGTAWLGVAQGEKEKDREDCTKELFS